MNKPKFLLALCAIWFLGLATPGWGQRKEFGTITASAANCTAAGGARVVLTPMANDASALITLSGTWAGTVEWFGTADEVNYFALNGDPYPSGAAVSTATANGTWRFGVSGMASICVRASTYTSGIINVLIRSTAAFAGKSSFTTTPSFLTMTENSIPYFGAGGLLSQNNANLFWTNGSTLLTANNLTVPTTATFTARSEGEPLTVDASGVLTSSPSWKDATVFAGATAGAKIAAAWAALLSTGGTVDARGIEGTPQAISADMFSGLAKPLTLLFGCATYQVSARSFISTSNVHIISQPCTTFQVTDAAASDIFAVNSTASKVIIEGGVFDGNSLAVRGITVTGSADDITIRGVEIKDTTSYGVQTAQNATNVLIEDSYVHDTVHGLATDSLTGASKAIYRRNRIEDVTGNAIRMSGAQHGEAYSNWLTNTTAASIYAYGADYVDWHDNVIRDGAASHIHCDVCGGGKINNNTSINAAGTAILPETSPFFEVNGNLVIESADAGIVLGAAAAYTPVQKNALDVTTGLTANTNITLAADAVDFQEGAASLQATVAAGFTTGYIFYEDLGASVDTDYDGEPWEQIWVKSDTALAAGLLQIRVSALQNHSTQLLTYDFPNIPANTWVQVRLYEELWAAKIFGQVKSWGVWASSDPGAVVLHFDDYTLTRNRDGIRAAGNSIFNNEGSLGFRIGGTSNAVVEGNYVEAPCNGNAGACRAYVAANTASVIFTDNRARMVDRGTTSYFLDIDATSTVYEGGSISSGEDTKFNVAGGGTLNYGPLTTTPGTAGTDIAYIAGVLNAPDASATARGVIASSGSQTLAPALTLTGNATFSAQQKLKNGANFVTTVAPIARSLTDNVATNFFTITTTDETGSTDGGGYTVKFEGLCHNNASSTAANAAIANFAARFAHVSVADGTGANTAVTEIWDGSGAGDAAVGTGDVTTIVMTIVDTSNYVKTVQMQVDGVAGGGAVGCKGIVDLTWTGYTTEPVVAVAP